MPHFDTTIFDPPAPVARVTLRNPVTGQHVSDIPMLLDTGADTTLLPIATVRAVGISINHDISINLTAFDGTPSESAIAEAHLIVEGFNFRGKFILIDQPVGIIGRDVLNLLFFTMDGARLNWDLKNPRSMA